MARPLVVPAPAMVASSSRLPARKKQRVLVGPGPGAGTARAQSRTANGQRVKAAARQESDNDDVEPDDAEDEEQVLDEDEEPEEEDSQANLKASTSASGAARAGPAAGRAGGHPLVRRNSLPRRTSPNGATAGARRGSAPKLSVRPDARSTVSNGNVKGKGKAISPPPPRRARGGSKQVTSNGGRGHRILSPLPVNTARNGVRDTLSVSPAKRARAETEEEEEDMDEEDVIDYDELLDEGDTYHLAEATVPELLRLRKADLTRLYLLALDLPATTTTDELTKPELAEGVVAGRDRAKESDDEEQEVEAEDEEADDSEQSEPLATTIRRAGAVRKAAALATTTATAGAAKHTTFALSSRSIPTPPPSASASGTDVESSAPLAGAGRRKKAAALGKGASTAAAGGAKLNRRATAPALMQQSPAKPSGSGSAANGLGKGKKGSTSAAAQGHYRTRSGSTSQPKLKSKKALSLPGSADEAEGEYEDDEEGEWEEMEMVESGRNEKGEKQFTPIARRTRHGTSSTTAAPAPVPGQGLGREMMKKRFAAAKEMVGAAAARPTREAAKKAEMRTARMVVSSDSEQEEEEVVEEEEDEDDEANMSLDSAAASETDPEESDFEEGDSGRVRAERLKSLRQRGAVAEEEEAEADDEDEIEGRAARRLLRNGKVLQLQDVEMYDEDEADEEEGDESVEMLEDDDEELVEDEEEEGAEIDLARATSKSLLRYRRDDLVRLCEERELDGEGTKKELVHALLEWRNTAEEYNSSDLEGDDRSSSPASDATARQETKTQALRHVRDSSPEDGTTPLLMRSNRHSSPNKPQTLPQSKAHEEEEVNALDLESLNLQDKEIPPSKLKKLEKIGSGGFKDVYKGVYRKVNVAISDIRGHLTEMDIKELGLLRDLRHANVVRFIGVSIPEDPRSSVPVMIVTELCANGDLFDYLRNVPHPPFTHMLDIMLGVARGLLYLHTRKPSIIHRDVKSSNVLITSNGTAKITDFGLARVKTSTTSKIRSLVGTVNWQAPELWVPHPRYNEKVDVFSTALVMWEILQWHLPVKRYPFEGLNEHAIYHDVGGKHLRPPTASMGRQWGVDILNLVDHMWQQDPSDRPSMADVVQELERIKVIAKEKERAAAA